MLLILLSSLCLLASSYRIMSPVSSRSLVGARYKQVLFDVNNDNSADDTVEEPRKGLSAAMQEKMRRELQSQGNDPNVSAGNPILLISGIVAILVILGGKGYFY